MNFRAAAFASCFLAALAAGAFSLEQAEDNGSSWHLQGEGTICCPCTEPCPCRSNHSSSYAHCEATLYLHIKAGHYGNVDLGGLNVVETSGPCAMNYRQAAVLYFDPAAMPEQKQAFMQLVASFFPERIAAFTRVKSGRISAVSSREGQLKVVIPGVLEMEVDRNWGKARRQLPFVAASDYYANTIQYVRNLRYQMSDKEAGLVFDYSHRQANYRIVDLGNEQYLAKSMLAQFIDGKGWFNDPQLQIIESQHLPLPDLKSLAQQIAQWRSAQP